MATFFVSVPIKPAMSYPLLADSLNLESWSLVEIKTTTKSKQRYAPIMATGKRVLVKISSKPLACLFGIGSLERVGEWAKTEGEKLMIRGTYKPLLRDNERYGNKKVKVNQMTKEGHLWAKVVTMVRKKH